MKNNLRHTIMVATLVLAASGRAQDTQPVDAPSVVSAPVGMVGGAVTGFLRWIDDNATIGSGYGITLQGTGDGHGVLFRQTIKLYEQMFKQTSIGFGIDHATVFTEPTNHEQIGVSLTWKLWNTQPLQDAKAGTPVLRKLPLNLSELMISPYIGVDIDKLVEGRFYARTTVVGIGTSWAF